MTIIRTNFRRGPPVIMTGLLVTTAISQYANASGMIFWSASQLFIWDGSRYLGWSLAPTLAGTGLAAGASFSNVLLFASA